MPNGRNRRRTVDLFQPLRAYFPVRPGKLLSRYFFYGTIEAACGELRRKDDEASYRPLLFAYANRLDACGGRTARIAPLK